MTYQDNTVVLTIQNNTGADLDFSNSWFDSGQIATGTSWPSKIPNTQSATITCYAKSGPAGCSGYANFNVNNQTITIAFSNPSVGSNKVGVGLAQGVGTANEVWDDMSSHDYKPFQVMFSTYNADCSCTGGNPNKASVAIGVVI